MSCDLPNEANADCWGDSGGTAYMNACGECVGGNTNRENDYGKSNCGVCFGDYVYAGSCSGSLDFLDSQKQCCLADAGIWDENSNICTAQNGNLSWDGNNCAGNIEDLNTQELCCQANLGTWNFPDKTYHASCDNFDGTLEWNSICTACGTSSAINYDDRALSGEVIHDESLCIHDMCTDYLPESLNSNQYTCDNSSNNGVYGIGQQLSCEDVEKEYSICYPDNCDSTFKLADFYGKAIYVLIETSW